MNSSLFSGASNDQSRPKGQWIRKTLPKSSSRNTALEDHVEVDVSVERESAAELAQSFAQLNSVLESTSDQVLTIGHDWVVRYANRRSLESLPGLQVGADYWSCFPSLAGSVGEKYLREAMQRRLEMHYQSFYAAYERWYDVRIYPVDEGITVFFSDITEQKTLEEELSLEQLLREKRIEALSYMAGGLAHEISNPLAIIHGWAHDLKKIASEMDVVPASQVGTMCDKILKTTSRASSILRGLRAFAREAAQDPMELASVELIVAQSLELQESRFERQKVEIRTALDESLPPLLCREVQIGQILTNLLNNAYDAIVQSEAAERWVSISAKVTGLEVQLDVTDSGPGMDSHQKAHLMEPFFSTKELGLGVGVGLSLSRAIAQDHGGCLILARDSEHTCFRLNLPIAGGTSRQNSDNSLTNEAPHELEQG